MRWADKNDSGVPEILADNIRLTSAAGSTADTKLYILLCKYRPIDHLQVTCAMPKDITHVIESLRNTAVGRCRERIDEAARRAKELIEDEETKTHQSSYHDAYGVTSVLKRKHGL